MRGLAERQAKMLMRVTTEDFIPENHLIRLLDRRRLPRARATLAGDKGYDTRAFVEEPPSRPLPRVRVREAVLAQAVWASRFAIRTRLKAMAVSVAQSWFFALPMQRSFCRQRWSSSSRSTPRFPCARAGFGRSRGGASSVHRSRSAGAWCAGRRAARPPAAEEGGESRAPPRPRSGAHQAALFNTLLGRHGQTPARDPNIPTLRSNRRPITLQSPGFITTTLFPPACGCAVQGPTFPPLDVAFSNL